MISSDKLKAAYDAETNSMLKEKGDGMRAAIEIEKLFNKRCNEDLSSRDRLSSKQFDCIFHFMQSYREYFINIL